METVTGGSSRVFSAALVRCHDGMDGDMLGVDGNVRLFENHKENRH